MRADSRSMLNELLQRELRNVERSCILILGSKELQEDSGPLRILAFNKAVTQYVEA